MTPVRTSGFRAEYIDHAYNDEHFTISQVADDAGAKEVVDKVMETEAERASLTEGGIPNVEFNPLTDENGDEVSIGDVLKKAAAAYNATRNATKGMKIKAEPIERNYDEEGDLSFSVDEASESEAEESQVMFSVSPEEAEIQRKAKEGGYIGKAPNGKPSRLTERQWLQTRTNPFKEWFGDWEKAAKITLMKNLAPISLNGLKSIDKKAAEKIMSGFGEATNITDGRTVKFVTDSVGKILGHKGFDYSLIIPKIKELYEESVPMYFEKEVVKPGHKDHTSNFVGYHHYVNKITFEGKDYYVRMAVQEVRTRKKDYNPNQFHSAHITDVEIYNTDTSVTSGIIDPATGSTGIKTDAKLQNFFETAKNSSKIVDENGEPLVVYKRTAGKVNVFDTKYGGFFSSEPIEDLSFGDYVGKYYLDIKKPLTLDAKGVSWSYPLWNFLADENGSLPKTKEEYEKVISERNLLEMAPKEIWDIVMKDDLEIDFEDAAYLINEYKLPYDGAIVKNIGEGADGNQQMDDFIVLNPNQIKSADPVTYDDAGKPIPLSERFNPEKDDIRFSVDEVGESEAEESRVMFSEEEDAKTEEELVRKGPNESLSFAEKAARNGFDRTTPTREESVDIIKTILNWARNKITDRRVISAVTDRQLKRYKALGLDINADYIHSIDTSEIRHEEKRHKKDNRTQIPLTDDEMTHIVEVIEDYDELNRGGKTNTGLDTVIYKKDMGDGTIFYVEEIRTGNKTLSFKTGYKKRKQVGSSDELLPNEGHPQTSKTTPDNPKDVSNGKDNANNSSAQEKPEKSGKISFSISPAEDAEYMDAVEKGDMATAERMVKEAAKRAMPDTKVVDENGEPKVVYHGTKPENKFYTFERNKVKSSNNFANVGFWFGESEDFARDFVINSVKNRLKFGKRKVDSADSRTIGAYISMKTPLVYETPEGRKPDELFGTPTNDAYDQFKEDAKWFAVKKYGKNFYDIGIDEVKEYIEYLKERGYDGIIIRNTYYDKGHNNGKPNTQYCVFDPNQIKSADPVTYDDAGKPIPLSERFNPEKDDIRFSVGEDERDTEREDGSSLSVRANAAEEDGTTWSHRVTPAESIRAKKEGADFARSLMAKYKDEPRLVRLGDVRRKPTMNDYHIGTRATFDVVAEGDEVDIVWQDMKDSGNYEHEQSPKSDSEYLKDNESGDIYRKSDHWGRVATCMWRLDGKDTDTYAIGKAVTPKVWFDPNTNEVNNGHR